MTLIAPWTSPSHRPSAAVFDKHLYLFNGWDRARVYDGISGSDHAAGIDGPPQTWSGANVRAAGVSTVGTHRVRYRYYDVDRNNFSAPSNAVSVVIAGGGDEQVTFNVGGLNEIQLSPDSRVDFIILEVTQIDQVEFFEAARVPNDGTTPVFNLADNDLAEFTLPWPEQVGTVPPPLFRFGIRFRSRIWGAGQVVHEDGTVSVTNGSPTVTGVGTNFTLDGIEGRYFEIGTTKVRIASVASATSLTLAENWPGTTQAAASYRIYTEDDLLFWSEANYPEVFFGDNSIAVWNSVTGLASYGSDMLIFGQSTLDRLTYSNAPEDGVRREVPGNRGAYTHHAIVQVDGTVYVMDRRGIYAYQGGTPTHISRPIDTFLVGFVDEDYVDKIHAVWYPSPRVIRWFYVRVGEPTGEPKTYVEYDLSRQAWSVGELDVPVTGGEGYQDRQTLNPVVGDDNGYTWYDDNGISAGGGPTTPARIQVLEGSSPTNTFVPLEPNQLGVFDNLDGVLVRNEQDFTAVVDFNDASSLTLQSPGFATPPDAGSWLQIGRLVSRLRTRAHYMDGSWKTRKRGVYLWLHFEPQTEGEFRVRFYRNLSNEAYRAYDRRALDAAMGRLEQEGVAVPDWNRSDFTVSLAKADGVVKIPVGGEPWRVVQAEIEVVEARSTLILYGYQFTSAEGRETRA